MEFPGEVLGDVARSLERRGAAAVREDAEAVRRLAVQLAPHRYGNLQAGIVVTGPENSWFGQSFAYDVRMAPNMDQQFARYTKDGKRYYYPASQEYGFYTREPEAIPKEIKKSPACRGRVSSRRRVPGKYFMRTAARVTYDPFVEHVTDVVNDIIKEAAEKHD